MKHKARLTICKSMGGGEASRISISIEDEDAGINFVELSVPLSAFAEAITGLGHVQCEMEVRGLANVGKKIERDMIEFPMPEYEYKTKKETAAKEAKKFTPDGWHASDYYGSQQSFFNKGKQEWARTSITRWVDKEVE